MTSEELLDKVFGSNDDAMLTQLMSHDSNGSFGWVGTYVYLRVLFKSSNGRWVFYKKNKSTELTYSEALTKANEIRNQLIEYSEEIKKIGEFNSINDYKKLEQKVKHIFYYQYNWVLKYFQMIYPQIFSCIYAADYLRLFIKTIGLPSHSSKLLNNGEIALFNKRIPHIPNHLLMGIYSDEFGWNKNTEISDFAKMVKRN